MNIDGLFTALQNLKIYISAREISHIWGMDEASFSRKKKAGTEIKQKNIEQLENYLNVNLSDNNIKFMSNDFDDIIKIPYWNGLPPELKNPDFSCVTAERKVITHHWNLKPENLCIVSMVGDKMTKYWYPIKNGDILIIDTSKNYIMGNGVYFATSQNNTRYWIREMQILVNDDVEFKGFAPSGNTTRILTKQELDAVDFKVIGKVIKNVSFRL